MPQYSRILDGEEIEQRWFNETPPMLAASKGKWVPIRVEEKPAYDATTSVLETKIIVTDDEVVRTHQVRDFTSDEHKAYLINAIIALEATITTRRIREAALTADGLAWLQGVDSQISELRTTLRSLG